MVESKIPKTFKLAAIDLDGTLLGPGGTLSEANRQAVAQLQEAGLQVVIASGRHYQSLRPFAEALPGVQWVISCQGAEVASLDRRVVLHSQALGRSELAEILELGRSLGLDAVAYGEDSVFTVSDWDANLEFYAQFAAYRPVPCALADLLGRAIFKVIWMGTPEAIEHAKGAVPAQPKGYHMVQTHARFLEFMPAEVSKASGLKILTGRLGVRAAEVITFGDGDNDVPMFEWSGLSVAMPHGWPAALRSATYVAPAGPPETALARGVEMLLVRKVLAIRTAELAA